jgi:hypothetical protein
MIRKSRDIITSASGVRDSGSRKVAREILEKTRQRVSHMTVHRDRYRQGLKPFHVIAKPLKTKTHIEDRKWLANETDTVMMSSKLTLKKHSRILKTTKIFLLICCAQ